MPWALAASGGLGLALLSLRLGLNGDVQYVLGGLQVAPDGFAGTFVHRPLAYRAAMAALDALARLVGSPVADLARYEAVMRTLGMLASASAGLLLWRALQARLHAVQGATIGLAIGLTLALPPAWDFLQPEWLATLFAVLAVAAAVGLRNRLPAALVAGICLTLVIGMKLATAPLALVALLVLWWLDRSRAADAAWAAAAISVASLIALMAFLPLEWRWVQDMAALNPNSVGRGGLDIHDLDLTARTLGAKLALQPLLVLVPAAVVVLVRQRPAGARWRLVVGAAAAAGLAISPMVLQGQYYLYHLAMLPVLGAGLVAAAVGSAAARGAWLVPSVMAIMVVACTLALGAGQESRAALGPWVGAGLAAVAVIIAILAAVVSGSWAATQRAASAVVLAVLAASIVLAAVPAVAPGSAWSPDPRRTPWTNSRWPERSATKHEQLAELRQRIGAGATVLYLAYGDVPYHLGNPTDCRYPSPLFVQRGPALPYVTAFSSYADNLACLTFSNAAYAVIQPEWFGLDGLLPEVRNAIDARWDCSAPLVAGDAIACPRRPGA